MNRGRTSKLFSLTAVFLLFFSQASYGAMKTASVSNAQTCITTVTKTKTRALLCFFGVGVIAYTLYHYTRPTTGKKALLTDTPLATDASIATAPLFANTESNFLKSTLEHGYCYQHPDPIDYSSTDKRRLFQKHIQRIQKITDSARAFFDQQIAGGINPQKAGVIIFDIDGTLITGSFCAADKVQEIIEPAYILYHYLVQKGFVVDIITNRGSCAEGYAQRQTTQDLVRLGYSGYRALHMRPIITLEDNVEFGWKAVQRKKIAEARTQEVGGCVEEGILASFGDVYVDFLPHSDGATYAGKIFKLPEIPCLVSKNQSVG